MNRFRIFGNLTRRIDVYLQMKRVAAVPSSCGHCGTYASVGGNLIRIDFAKQLVKCSAVKIPNTYVYLDLGVSDEIPRSPT